MTANDFIQLVCRDLTFSPTADQLQALDIFTHFIADRNPDVAMIMSGAAGTGKTWLAGALVKTLARLGQKMVLLAPTGRAAKVLTQHTGTTALTIHRKIYREKTYTGLPGMFALNDNLHTDTLFIVDESSMISNSNGASETAFGTGCLLDDLITFVYGGRNCRIMFIGDKAQLPPIGEKVSPALSAETLGYHGLKVYLANMQEVVRQQTESGILYNATVIRLMHDNIAGNVLPKIKLDRFADIQVVTGEDLVESIASSYSRVGIDDTIVITRSNKRANIYNTGIRSQILGQEERLCRGDRLMIVKNNYMATAGLAAHLDTRHDAERIPAFIANGDTCRIMRVRGTRKLYGFEFADAVLTFPDYDDFELQTTLMLDTLTSDAPALTKQQQQQLYDAVTADYSDMPRKAERMAKLRNDRHYNALQIKYGYAVTCHKAQGGQWAHVYLDQGYITGETITEDYINWLYTAFTRATEKLFLVNWHEKQIEKSTHSFS